MGSVRFDRSRWPIVVVELEGKPSDATIDEYLRGLTALLQEDARGVVIVDMTRAQPSAPEQCKRIGEWMREYRAQLAERGLGVAFVISSGVFRFVLSSIFLIQRPPMPYTVEASLEDAVAWAQQQLRGHQA
jgi:hypothetical protein